MAEAPTLEEIQKRLQVTRSKLNEVGEQLRNNIFSRGRGKYRNNRRNYSDKDNSHNSSYSPFNRNRSTHNSKVNDDDLKNEDDDLAITPTKRVAPVLSPAESQRNKRLLSSLLGHLERAQKNLKKDEKSIHQQIERQNEVYNKTVQEQEEFKSEYIIKERKKYDEIQRVRIDNLYENDKAQTELLCYKLKQNYHKMSNYLQTKTLPMIFYKPVKPLESEDEMKEMTNEWVKNKITKIDELRIEMLDNVEQSHKEKLEKLEEKMKERHEKLESKLETIKKEGESENNEIKASDIASPVDSEDEEGEIEEIEEHIEGGPDGDEAI